jgi:hypothetical protein
MRFRIFAAALALVCCAGHAGAQTPLRIQISGGRVTLHAQNVPVRTILAEWARIGGAHIVNGDRVAGAPVTLDLEGVPERQALDIILRGSAGYIAGERASAAQASQSSLDRIMVFPTAGTATTSATTVAARPVTAAPPTFQQAPQAFVQPDPDEPADVPDDDRPNRGTRPGVPPVIRMVAPNGQVVAQPFVIEDDAQPAPAPTATPSNPFGVTGGSARPGMPPPPPPQPQRPANTRDQEP